MRDGGQMKNEIGRATERGVNDHRVLEGLLRQNVSDPHAGGFHERTARADRRAISNQIGWPEGARAECGRDIPRASATTWDVAAVPRN